MKISKEPVDMLDSISMVSSCSCTCCGKEEKLDIDDYEFVVWLSGEGWVMMGFDLVCPKCYKKKSKRKSK